MSTETEKPKLVTLVQCSKSRCGHVLTEDEYVWKSNAKFGLPSATGTCPKCGGDSFYTLNTQGQHRKMSDSDKPREINPEDINPSPRMGLKMRRRILAAKRRATKPTPEQ